MKKYLIIGSSHALIMAQSTGKVDADWNGVSKDIIQIQSDDPDHSFHLFLTTAKTEFYKIEQVNNQGIVVFNQYLVKQLDELNTADLTVLFAINGNEHNSRFMTTHPKPFDFYYSKYPTLLKNRQIIPRSVIEKLINDDINLTRHIIYQLSLHLTNAKKYVVAPPPPIFSEDQITSSPEIFDFVNRSLEDPMVRLKVYDIYLGILNQIADQANISLLAPPDVCRDENGFILKKFEMFCTHAKPQYYEHVFNQIGVTLHAPI